jgi:hypothetical protein
MYEIQSPEMPCVEAEDDDDEEVRLKLRLGGSWSCWEPKAEEPRPFPATEEKK